MHCQQHADNRRKKRTVTEQGEGIGLKSFGSHQSSSLSNPRFRHRFPPVRNRFFYSSPIASNAKRSNSAIECEEMPMIPRRFKSDNTLHTVSTVSPR